MNNTAPAHVELIRKPVLTAMGLLSYLGEKQVKVELQISRVKQYTIDSIGTIGTIHEPSLISRQDR